MSLKNEIAHRYADHFTVIILDNEVTLDAFVKTPPLSWTRLVRRTAGYTAPKEYPTLLTKEESNREEMNWDRVDLERIQLEIGELEIFDGLIAIGNNAAQGLPLARATPISLRENNSIIIYGTSLPEKPEYQSLGYNKFCSRTNFLNHLDQQLLSPETKIAFVFINTIQHNEVNYHQPWDGR